MDDLERDLRGMLNDRVSGMPDAHDAAPELIARSHRRRVSKLTAIGVAAVVVAVGVTGAVVRSVGGSDAHRLSTAPTVTEGPTSTTATAAHRPGVAVLGCPVVYAVNGAQKLPPPPANIHGRIPAAGDPAELAGLVSFAASSDPRYVVLGPETWSCLTTVATDGSNSVVVYDPAKTPGMVPDVSNAPIAVLNDYLWHGGVGSGYACSVFSDPALVQYVNQNYPQEGPCPRAGRVVTRVDAHMSTFVDADGARGVGWMAPPTSAGADDGKLTVLTCRPTGRLTAAGCDTVIAEFEARNEPAFSAPTPAISTTSTTTSTTQPFAGAPSVIPATSLSPLTWVPAPNGMVVSDYLGHIEAYDTTSDAWHAMASAPFSGQPWLLSSSGNQVFALGLQTTKPAQTPFAVLDVGTGQWKKLAALPDDLYAALDSCSGLCPSPSAASGDASHLFVYAGINKQVPTDKAREIAFDYDIAANQWTKLPRSPLSFRYGSAVQWTGRELLVWGGADFQNVNVRPSYADGAAYDPATRTWRSLPPAPMPPSAGAASVWTGTQMIVWGGSNFVGHGDGSEVGDGAAYNPTTNSWTKLAPSPLRPTTIPAAIWTGREMLVFVGREAETTDAAAYDPATNQWRSLPLAPASVRALFQANQATYASWIGDQAVFAVVTPGGQLAAFRYPIH